jgi:hypothetical protein
MKNLILVLVASVLVENACTAGTMSASANIVRYGSTVDSIININFSSDGSVSSYRDANGNVHVVYPNADGSSSFPFILQPGNYVCYINTVATAYPPSSAPYGELGSDNAYVHYFFNYSTGNPGDTVYSDSSGDGLNAAIRGYTVINYDSANTSEGGYVVSKTGSRFGSAGGGLLRMNASASLVVTTTPNSCGVDAICLAQTSTISTEPDWSLIAAPSAVANALIYITKTGPLGTNQTPTDFFNISFRSNPQSGLGINNGNGVSLPIDRIVSTNSFFPSYVFTNVASGSAVGVNAYDGVDFEMQLIMTSPSLVQSITLPNCTNSLTVTVSNVNVGAFSGGQAVYFTNFPSGGVSQFSVSANGQPLPTVSGLELPLVLAFNSPTGAFTLTPQLLRIVAPVTDQFLKPGQDLTIQPIVSSEQPIHYQWQLQDNDLPDQTNALLAIPAFTALNAGNYRLKMQADENGQTQTFYSPESSIVAVSPPSLAYAGLVNDTNGSLQFMVSGTSGQAFFLQSSTDLQNWQTIATNSISTNGSVTVQVNNNSGFPVRFIRTESPLTLRLGP